MINILAFHVLVFIYELYDKRKLLYRAFCAGSIITKDRVLTSTHCFLSNRKRRIRNFHSIRVVGGILDTLVPYIPFQDIQQWRTIEKLYSQRFYRFPAYNLAILKVNEEWNFNQFVNKIPYTQWNQDFDGVCYGTTVKTTKSWKNNKSLFAVGFRMIPRRSCELRLLRCCELYYCTRYDIKSSTSVEIEGGGLICYGTKDPAEGSQGVLVGVTSLINYGLPSLHNRIGLHYQWVTDCCSCITFNYSLFICLVMLIAGRTFDL